MKLKQLAILTLVAAGAAAAGSAQARDNVQWSVTLASPFGLPLPPVPVITVQRPPAVVVAPQPVYAPPYRPAYVYGPAYGHPPRDGGWRHADADRDGIPNRYDRVYNPRWDRDGDGLPNRYDRHGRDDRDGRHGHDNRDDRGPRR